MDGQAKLIESTEDNVRTLINDAEKMGLTPDIRNLLEDFDNCKKRLETKVQELSVIEAIAMESMDENIRDLREQLFSVVKMIHSDEIAEVIEEYNNRDQRGGSVFEIKDHSDSNKIERTISKYDVIDRVRRYLNKREEYKRMKKITRKPQPTGGLVVGGLR